MSRILIENHGRMANQLVAWAKAMCWRKNPETEFLLHYGPLVDVVKLSNCVIVAEVDLSHWPAVSVGDESGTDNCKWPAQPLWDSQPPREEFETWLRSITFTPAVVQTVNALMGNDKFIGVHVRYGDYQAVNWNNPPVPLPVFVRATDDYFLSALALVASVLPGRKIFLASDGTDAELKWLMESVKVIRNAPDANAALDLYALSKCDIIIGSASTFGHLAAIHGNKPFIAPGHTLELIRQKAESVTK